MKMLKKFSALLLALVLLLSMTACHGKDEVALVINGVEIKSGLYMLALLEADSEAKQTVDTNLQSDEQAAAAALKEDGTTDYMSQTVEGVAFETFVKNRAIEKCKEFAFYQSLVNEGKLTLSKEEISYSDSMAEYYWDAGVGETYEKNGVSLETYKKANLYASYASKYFMDLYGEGGSKEVTKETRTEYLTKNFQLVYAMTTTYDEDATTEEKNKLKAKYEAYAERLKNGESFEKIYKEEYPDDEEETTSSATSGSSSKAESSSKVETSSNATSSVVTSSTTSSKTETSSATTSSEADSDEEKPKDELAMPIVDPESDVAANYQNSQYYTGAVVDDNFAEIYDLKKGEVKVIEDKEKTGVSIYVKLDITEDEYYLKAHSDNIIVALKQEEYNTDTKAVYSAYVVDENTYATNRFDVEDLEYAEATTTA